MPEKGERPTMVRKKRVNQVERRGVLVKAAEFLAGAASSSKFVQSYARMNPAAKLRSNAFFFGAAGRPPRVVIFGPWVYVHAPGAKLPPGVERLTEEFRLQKHLGALHARISLDSPEAIETLKRTVKALRQSHDATDRL
jgi:hypothetical protein